jgi:LemA protein
MTGIIVAIVVVAITVYLIATYNRLVRARQMADEGWSGIDVQLKRRADLIPNLVESVRGYAGHEQALLERVTELRRQADAVAPGDVAARGQAEALLSGAIGRLLAIVENYPDLKANQNFLALQEELTATEGRVAYARQFYNDSVLNYNNKLQQVPTVVFASMLKFEKREYFEADESARDVPKIGF